MAWVWVSQAAWDDLIARLTRIENGLAVSLIREKNLMAQLDQLTADVQRQGDVVASAVTLLQGLKAALDAAGTDPTKLAALSAQIEAQTQSLADAVAANTPAAP